MKTKPPKDFSYTEIETDDYVLASWQKIRDENSLIKIYIEGDGNAYNSNGYPSTDPTPKSCFLRNIVFNDTSENVVYLARPCQYIKSDKYNNIDWTTGRFSQKIVDNMAQAIKQIAGNKRIVLIGYSGGALLCGLIINQYRQELNIVKWITVAGLFNHTSWTKHFDYIPLKYSLDLVNIPDIEQTHYIGKKDTVIPYQLTLSFVDTSNCVIIEKATHSKGFNISEITNN
ncbi:MAG: serine hydrolase family protein [Endomicrobiaceae bacterium]|nr:serine hydrolase family protein [Endomicrobiaceae bacterium]